MVVVVSRQSLAQTSTGEMEPVLRKLDMLEASQAQILRELAALAREVATLRGAVPTSAPRVPSAPLVPVAPVSLDDVPVKGAPEAPIVVIEYGDFQCPYCGEFARRTLPQLMEKYVASGKIKLAFKHLPLQEIHPQAVQAAQTAECARRQGKFWEVHEALFSDQKLDQESLVAKARTAGVNIKEFGECVQGPGAAKVRQELTEARLAGLAVTPTFFLGYSQPDGRVQVNRVITGVKDAAAFSAALDEMLTAVQKR